MLKLFSFLIIVSLVGVRWVLGLEFQSFPLSLCRSFSHYSFGALGDPVQCGAHRSADEPRRSGDPDDTWRRPVVIDCS